MGSQSVIRPKETVVALGVSFIRMSEEELLLSISHGHWHLWTM